MTRIIAKPLSKRRVVVTGLGVIAPNGEGKAAFWQNTLAGKSGIHEIDRFPLKGFQSRIAGHVDNFDPFSYGIAKRQIGSLDRFALFSLAGAAMAIEDAGLEHSSLDRNRVGVNIANAICGTRHMEESFLSMTGRGLRKIDPKQVDRVLYQSSTFNVASSVVAANYQFYGPCATVSTGCTAGLDSIGYSLDVIRGGKADVMIAGSTEAPLTPIALAAFDVVGALSSKRNDTPQQASRPFDRDRDGFVLSEGCGILILEELNHALERNAYIYAEVKGFASTSNAYHMTDLPADGADMARSIDLALRDSNVKPSDVSYISAHGSSTRQNDTNETAAFKRVFGEYAYNIPISSIKSMTGHALSAANSIESVVSVLAIDDKRVPPTTNYEYQDPQCDLFYVPNQAIEKDVDVVVKNASGFSGIHSTAIFTSPQYGGIAA